MRVLNLYAGIGGNRKLWTDCEVTAVELNPEIAKIYKEFFPEDNIIIGDAHEYLLNHYKEYNFIWSSPPCQSHSVMNNALKGLGIVRYPDMKLYQEIILLRKHFAGKWIVENVKPYYEPLIKPTLESGRHIFWSNFFIKEIKVDYKIETETNRKAIIREAQIPELLKLHGVKDFKIKNKRQVLRNCVLPEIGLHIFNEARDIITYEENDLFKEM